jgi:hypothetical protein
MARLTSRSRSAGTRKVTTGRRPSSHTSNQLHNSLNGGCDGQGGIEDVLPPAPPAADIPPPAPLAEDVPAAAPLGDAEPPPPPYPAVFGPVTTLQKSAVISWIQNTPVVGACVGAAALPVAVPGVTDDWD